MKKIMQLTMKEPIEENDNVQSGDMMVDKAWLQDNESVSVTLKQVWEQRPTDVTPPIQSIRTLHKEIRYWHAQEPHQTTINPFFHYAQMYDDIHILYNSIL